MRVYVKNSKNQMSKIKQTRRTCPKCNSTRYTNNRGIDRCGKCGFEHHSKVNIDEIFGNVDVKWVK